MDSLLLNGCRYSADELIRLAEQNLENRNLSDWEGDLYRFLLEWFAPNEAIVVHTSGSTGKPKAISLPKTMMRQSAERTIHYFGLKPGNRILLALPCRYIAGRMMVVRALVGGMDLILTDPAGDFDLLEREHFAFSAMVPNQVFELLNKERGMEKLNRIGTLLIGGSSIATPLESRVRELANRTVLTYGMTETASHIAVRDLTGARRTDRYEVLPGITIGTTAGGCLTIRLAEGSRPMATKDMVEILSPTTFRLLGRRDDVIISGGIKFFPDRLEQTIGPFVDRRLVITSVADEKLGRKIVLVIEGEPFDTAALQTTISSVFTPYERPKTILFLPKFPETPNGKIKRKAVGNLIVNLSEKDD